MEKDEKLKALDAAISQIEKQYGKGAVMKLGDPSAQMNVETIPTGSLSLDIALGLGGIPKGTYAYSIFKSISVRNIFIKIFAYRRNKIRISGSVLIDLFRNLCSIHSCSMICFILHKHT